MRLVKQIPHERYLIQIHQYNGKYILKIELGQFEQLFKISEMDLTSLDDLEKMIQGEFLSNCLKRFLEMRTDWQDAFNKLQNQAL
jgi:hypothetical protein